MNDIIFNILVAASAGAAKALLGYLAVFQHEDFNLKKFSTGALIGLVGGGIAGVMANDWKLAIIGALGADDIRSFAANYAKK